MSAAIPAGLYRDERRADSLETFADLGPDAPERFAEQGYLVVRRAFSPERVAAALAAIDDLMTRPDTRACVQFEPAAPPALHDAPLAIKHAWVRKLMHYVQHDAVLGGLAADPALVATLERLMGEPPELFQDMALLKPAGVGSEKPWHQDCAYFDLPPECAVIGVWIALDEALPENGCMHLIPGSHRAGPRVHFQRRDWQLCDTDVESARDVVVPLPPGGALLFSGLLHHGTPPNRSSLPRRALQFHYKPASVAWTSREARLAVFGAEGHDAQC